MVLKLGVYNFYNFEMILLISNIEQELIAITIEIINKVVADYATDSNHNKRSC